MTYCAPGKKTKGNRCMTVKETKSVQKVLTSDDKQKCKGDELCIIKHAKQVNPVLDMIYEKRFLPEAPQQWKTNKKTWLSNFDINDIMKRYTNAYKSFTYLGTTSADFDKTCNLMNFDYCTFKPNKKYTRYAIVVNLSPYRHPGTHWVAYFANVKRGKQYGGFYFDSTGANASDILTSVHNLHERFKREYAFKDFPLTYNSKIYQSGDSECGIFCIAFIHLCLKYPSYTYEQICDHILMHFPKIDQAEERSKFFII